MIDAADAEAEPLKTDMTRFGTRQPACRALVDAHYGIGGLLSVAIWSELGDCRRFTRSEQAVRHSGLGRHRRRVGSPSSSWASVAARAPDVAVGVVRSRAQRVTTRQPRPRLLHEGERTSQRQDRGALGCPPVRPTLLSHLAQPRSRHRLRDADLSIAGHDGHGLPFEHHGLPPRSAPAMRVPATFRADGHITLTRPRSPLAGDTRSRLLSPTTPRSSSTQVTQGAPTPPPTGP